MRELRGPETVFIFQNARDAVDGERLLKAKGVQVRVMPLPVEISGSCGICLRVDAQDAEGAEALLRGAGIGPLSAFQR